MEEQSPAKKARPSPSPACGRTAHGPHMQQVAGSILCQDASTSVATPVTPSNARATTAGGIRAAAAIIAGGANPARPVQSRFTGKQKRLSFSEYMSAFTQELLDIQSTGSSDDQRKYTNSIMTRYPSIPHDQHDGVAAGQNTPASQSGVASAGISTTPLCNTNRNIPNDQEVVSSSNIIAVGLPSARKPLFERQIWKLSAKGMRGEIMRARDQHRKDLIDRITEGCRPMSRRRASSDSNPVNHDWNSSLARDQRDKFLEAVVMPILQSTILMGDSHFYTDLAVSSSTDFAAGSLLSNDHAVDYVVDVTSSAAVQGTSELYPSPNSAAPLERSASNSVDDDQLLHGGDLLPTGHLQEKFCSGQSHPNAMNRSQPPLQFTHHLTLSKVEAALLKLGSSPAPVHVAVENLVPSIAYESSVVQSHLNPINQSQQLTHHLTLSKGESALLIHDVDLVLPAGPTLEVSSSCNYTRSDPSLDQRSADDIHQLSHHGLLPASTGRLQDQQLLQAVTDPIHMPSSSNYALTPGALEERLIANPHTPSTAESSENWLTAFLAQEWTWEQINAVNEDWDQLSNTDILNQQEQPADPSPAAAAAAAAGHILHGDQSASCIWPPYTNY